MSAAKPRELIELGEKIEREHCIAAGLHDGAAMPNRLAHEKSPYLLQHANNPVAWFPWGEEAFAKARTEQKPIFLSIGYSTCHWCHVMEHESFENPDTAKILNEHFVSIKVDREERPDVDRVYMAYVQALTGHGGWPLHAWLTPELKPFYAGTYFPPEERHGRASFPNILRAIARGWQQERDRLVAESERVIETLRGHHAMTETSTGEVTLEDAGAQAYEQCFQYLVGTFDAQHGGFGSAPKFPRAANLNFLFRVAAIQSADSEAGREALRLATATLQAMARGGIHDHVGGGFHRYAVDGAWFVPHFEKMLYDQAQIAINCLDAKQASGDERFAWLARDIFSYVQRDLTSRAGGFFTAEDADSKVVHERDAHAEGAFYVWTKEELTLALNDGIATEFFCSHFGVADKGNVPPSLDPQGELEGQNVLAQQRPLADTAEKFSLSPEAANDRLLASLARLGEVRSRRPRPSLDDKVVTANNGLMISAFARGAAVLGDANYLVAARNAAEFVRRELFDAKRGVLFRSWRETRGATEGFAEDYAFFIQALLDLYEASFEIGWLQWAERLQETMDALFRDETRGGYFNSSAGDATIVLRLQDDYDGAEPAASSVAAMNLFRLGAMLHDEKWTERGRRCVDAFRSRWLGAPHAMPQMLCALELALEMPRHVVIAGDPAAADFRALAAVLRERHGRRRTLLAADGGEAQRWLASRAPWLAEMKPINGRAAAYVCEEYTCQAPVTDPTELRRLMS